MTQNLCLCHLQSDEIARQLMSLDAVALSPENSNKVPDHAGLYAIHERSGECLWIGHTNDLRDRIFNQHYNQGRDESAQSDLIRVVQEKKFKSTRPDTRAMAQEWIRENCVIRWFVLASERELRKHLKPIWGKR